MKEVCKGLFTETLANGIRHARLYHWADPNKDTDTEVGRAWAKRTVRGFPGGFQGPKWKREYLIDWAIRASERVFPMWDDRLYPRIVVPQTPIEEFWPLHAGYDYGLTNPFAFEVVAFPNRNQALVVDEIVESNKPQKVQSRLMKEKDYFDRLTSLTGDPSIWYRNQNVPGRVTATSVGEMFQDDGIYIDKGRNEPGVDAAFIEFLTDCWFDDQMEVREEPRLLISAHCTNLIYSLKMLRWKEHKSVQAKLDNDNKQEITHRQIDAFDALKYVCLSHAQFDSPESVGLVPGTVAWHRRRLKEIKRRKRLVLQ